LDRQAYARAIKLLADEMSEVLGTERGEVRAMLESAWEGNKLN
jgi:RNA polymerase-interacting CarD/CdnL/TRCF family regulator